MEEIKIPEILYHATWEENVMSIFLEGLKPGFDGLNYLCDKQEDAAKFLVLKIQPGKQLVVLKIYTKNLDKELFDYGFDHNPNFFGNLNVLTYKGIISKDHISSLYTKYEFGGKK
ncbi:MAG: hypothetical protein K0Q47_61 [Sedimentibacter sp.]|jgi:hypothetical protein|nr:hypothetical protein [Sedimentibacter sp.]